jgi:polysaccharide biosynthesis protein PslG
MRQKLSIAIAALALLALPHAAAARPPVPAGFFGISPQSQPNELDYGLMEEAGVRSLRLPLPWAQVEPLSPFVKRPDWSAFDFAVGLAAEHGLRVFPFLGSTPAWVAPELRLEPSGRGWQLRAWASFVRLAVRRYGAHGAFWRENPDVPYLPIRAWEVWNEENIVTFGRADPERFARLLRISGRTIHRADRNAKVILGGLFGRPLQIPPNVGSGDYLSRLYRARRVKKFFDGIALHPYVADATAMRAQIRNLRRVLRVHHDGAKPLYVTELGWGSAGYQTRWERGLRGQARELSQAFSMLSRHRRSWRIGGAWWFTWTDGRGGCQFCDSAGLLTEDHEAKPSWYVFNRWTGGDPGIVPRMRFAP